MKIFGLGYDGFHDSSVAAMETNGRVIFAINEERITKIKKDGRFPKNAFEMISSDNEDILCISNQDDENCRKSFEKAGVKIGRQLRKERDRIFGNINSIKKRFRGVFFVSHHDCHAASAYYFSGFDRAVVVTWDAGNNSEPWNLTVQIGRGCELERVEESIDGSPCLDYSAITALMGFCPGRHEGKVTGLSAMGKSSKEASERLIYALGDVGKHNSLIEKISYWRNVGCHDKIPQLVINRAKSERARRRLNMCREDLAHAIQRITEEKVVGKISKIKERYGERNICLAGGLFANVLLNKRIRELGFKNIFIHPAMGDDGLALGACAKYLGLKGLSPVKLEHVFLGPTFSDEYIEECLTQLKMDFYRSSDIETDIADKLRSGNIVARFSGRMEYGPRALGNRSILCEATDPKINRILNRKLKRSEFMPFAPITLEKDAHEFYENIEGAIYASKFMTMAFDTTRRMREESPAVVHVDGTARPQFVGNENPALKRILKKYKKMSGLSSLVNTSLNMHERPIVNTPEDAIAAFLGSKLDILAINSFIVSQR